jgi:hypothetical protein
MDESASNDGLNNQYIALERLYSERRWTEVEADAALLLGAADGEVDGKADGSLRARVLLLLGHTRLYGFNDPAGAAEHYRRVLGTETEPVLLGIAQAGLNQCLEPASAIDPGSIATGPSPSDAMPWLEKIPEPSAAVSSDSQPTPKMAKNPFQTFRGVVQSESVQSYQNLDNQSRDRSNESEIDKAKSSPETNTKPKALWAKSQVYFELNGIDKYKNDKLWKDAAQSLLKLVELKPEFQKEEVNNYLFVSAIYYFNDGINAYNATKYTETYINNLVEDAINKILSGKQGFLDSLNPIIQKNAESTFKKYNDFYVGEVKIEK